MYRRPCRPAYDAAQLLVEIVRAIGQCKEKNFAEAAEILSNKPEYGTEGQAGGVNVDHQRGITYSLTEDATWVTLEDLVTVAMKGGGAPDWWDSEWTTGMTSAEIDGEIADEVVNDAAKRIRFMEFGTGDPIVNIAYSYDDMYVYQKCGRVTERAELTPPLLNQLNLLSPSDVIEAAHVFNEASSGRARGPI